MSPLYRLGHHFGRFTFFCTMRTAVSNAEVVRRPGGWILAVTHLSHLEPVCASILQDRPVDWITRKEFFRFDLAARALRAMKAIKVNRQGISVSTIREGIARARAGRVVGICPEGGVTVGREAAIRGGPIKRGVCSIAIRAQVPVIPCVILGTHRLNVPGPWIPFRRAKIWVAYGEPIHPPAGVRSTRATRRALAERIVRSYQEVYAQLRERHGIADGDVP